MIWKILMTLWLVALAVLTVLSVVFVNPVYLAIGLGVSVFLIFLGVIWV